MNDLELAEILDALGQALDKAEKDGQPVNELIECIRHGAETGVHTDENKITITWNLPA